MENSSENSGGFTRPWSVSESGQGSAQLGVEFHPANPPEPNPLPRSLQAWLQRVLLHSGWC